MIAFFHKAGNLGEKKRSKILKIKFRKLRYGEFERLKNKALIKEKQKWIGRFNLKKKTR